MLSRGFIAGSLSGLLLSSGAVLLLFMGGVLGGLHGIEQAIEEPGQPAPRASPAAATPKPTRAPTATPSPEPTHDYRIDCAFKDLAEKAKAAAARRVPSGADVSGRLIMSVNASGDHLVMVVNITYALDYRVEQPSFRVVGSLDLDRCEGKVESVTAY